MPNITVSHTVLGHGAVAGDASPALTLELELDRISVGELIARTVERQIALLEAAADASASATRAMLDRCYLGKAEIDAMAAVGRVAMPRCAPAAPDVDTALETERALTAFAAGQYRVFVDGRELRTLDEEVAIEGVASARFLRVVPLVGG